MSSYDPYTNINPQLIQLQRWLKGKKPPVFTIVLVALGVFGIATSYYQVEPDQVGVVLRFRSTYRRRKARTPLPDYLLGSTALSRYRWSSGKMEFGFRTVQAGIESQFSRDRQAAVEANMVTGDRNVAIVNGSSNTKSITRRSIYLVFVTLKPPCV
ncbi:MAG: hypothetical protein R3C68_04660 [Myxococcota bacterium]